MEICVKTFFFSIVEKVLMFFNVLYIELTFIH